jgi:hypothetical protein
MEKLTIITRPTESITAKSGLLVPAHTKWTMGIVGLPLTKGHVVGSLRSHEPSSGERRR